MEKRTKLLSLLRENARYTADELAERTGFTAAEVAAEVAELERNGVIRGYTAILNEDALSDRPVDAIDQQQAEALIEVRVTPRRDGGFDQVAQRIAKFPEVSDVALISGGFDLLLTVQGGTLQEVAGFVASKLATIDGVMSTSTGFILKKYKESGRIMEGDEDYERLKICL